MTIGPPRQHDLFGGAIVAELPAGLVDASDFRPIPDNQEVFLYPDSSKTLIIEVLQCVGLSDSNDAIKYHFESLAHDNAADSTDIFSVNIVPSRTDDDTPSPILLDGRQSVKKFNASVADNVRIFMALYRVVTKNADLVLTLNVPIDTTDGGAVGEDGVATALQEFKAAALSLRIRDFGLFA